MALSLPALVRRRPYLFHLTARENVVRIARDRVLQPAVNLMAIAQRLDLLETRRSGHLTLELDGDVVRLRDQAPLYANNMRLDGGWTFGQFIRHLNSRVFFWPGWSSGPIDYGRRHFDRYAEEHPAILRVPFQALLDVNIDAVPELCRYNSGSPRWSRGLASPRGAATFVNPDTAEFGVSQVVEVTFPISVRLPESTELGTQLGGPWTPLV